MHEPSAPIKPARSIADALGRLVRPPFVTLVALSVLVTVVSSRLSTSDNGALFSLLVLALVSTFIQIATCLAAAISSPEKSADRWLVAAFRNRCFWRFIGTSLLFFVMIVAGIFAAVVGAFIVGGIFALSLPAAAIDRQLPIAALKTSAALTRPIRLPVIVIFGVLYILPVMVLQLAAQLTSLHGWGLTLAGIPPPIFQLAALIAVTRIFVSVRGTAAETLGTAA
ncbi:MAG: hypothetical protein M3290_12745 [Actinomycetota bacterium]|nr:hypothetical protein [Actinomycetota bacterium]